MRRTSWQMGQTMKNGCIGLKCEPERRLRLGKPLKESESSSLGGTVGLGSQDGSHRVVVFLM
jgi:hypothetical protein